MALYLTRNEIIFCFGVYFLAFAYGLYHAYVAGAELPQWTLPRGSILNRRQDVMEYNWLTFKRHADEYAFWLLAHIITSEVFRILWPMKVPLSHAFIGIVFIVCNGFPWGVIFVTVIVFYVVMRTRRCCIWFFAIICLTCRQFVRTIDAFIVLFDDYTSMADFLFLYTLLIVRATSYSLDYNRAMRKCYTYQDIPKIYSFSNYLGYVFYMPVMIHGPPLIYKRYAKMLAQRKYVDFARRSVDLICMLIVLTCGCVFLELARHFIYAEYMCENPHVAEHVNRWALMGFTVAIGMYFNVFYMISYGLGVAVASFDRIEAPSPPICIAHVNTYSTIWRHFDQGLYEYTHRYVYRDICGTFESSTKWRKILAALTAFLFINTWHGPQLSVIVWSALNIICLEMEIIGKRIAHTRFYGEAMRSIGADACDRISGFFGSQLLMVSVITNVYFIGGEDVGKVIANRAFFDVSIWDYLVTSAISYCCYQACEYLARRNAFVRKEIAIAYELKKLE